MISNIIKKKKEKELMILFQIKFSFILINLERC